MRLREQAVRECALPDTEAASYGISGKGWHPPRKMEADPYFTQKRIRMELHLFTLN